MNEDQTPKDEGSVWASYSDLFTNVAIIFLVMFVFALLKAGVSKMETALVKKQHDQELKGKLNPQEIAKSQERVKKVEQSISDMQKVESIVDDKIREMQQFAKSMEKNKVILKDLIEEQKKKDSLLNTVNEKITEKEDIIKKLQFESKQLEESLSLIESQRITLEEALRKKETISKTDQEKINTLQKQIKSQTELKSQKENEMKQLSQIVQKSELTIDSLEKENRTLSGRIESSEKIAQELKVVKDSMEEKIHDLMRTKSKMEKTIGELESKELQQNQSNQSLIGKLTQSEAERNEMSSSMERLNKSLDNKLAEINHLKNLHQKAVGQADAMGNQLKDAQEKMRNVGKALTEMKGKLRSSVADSLRRKFGSQNLNVQVDSDSGNVTLLMDNNLLFKKNSFDLSDQAQQNLSKIAPIYAEVIFGDPQVSSKIEAIEITGHASPSYKKNYVDPRGENPEAYGHNMRLSAQRAASIANFMMGQKIGNYPNKNNMRESLFAIGRSYISPIEKPNTSGRSLASVDGNCGPYDCGLSQRVEIGFRLKDDMKAIEKLINMAGAN